MIELKVFLTRHQLTQRDLADAIGLSQAAVSQMLSGKNSPSKTTIDAVLGFCRGRDPGVTYDDIFGEKAA